MYYPLCNQEINTLRSGKLPFSSRPKRQTHIREDGRQRAPPDGGGGRLNLAPELGAELLALGVVLHRSVGVRHEVELTIRLCRCAR